MALPRFVKVGRLTKDIELRYAVSGNEIAKTSIVWSEKNGDKEETCFMDLVAFGKTAITLNNYFKKGSRVEGLFKLQQESWTASDGSNRSKHSLRVETMKMLDSKNSDSTPPGHQYQTVRESSSPRENQSTYTRKPSMDATVPEIDIDDELPF